jgi:putative transposase
MHWNDSQEDRVMARKPYPSDLTDLEWALIEDLIPPGKPGGRPREVDMREVFSAIMYVLRSGCAWRLLPHDFPKWNIVYYYSWRFRKDGLWQDIHDLLRDQLRVREGRDVSPSAAIIDSQSVKTTENKGFAATMRARRSRGASAILS